MTLDERAARIARRQHALLARRQALDIGFTPKQIRTRLHRGQWVEIRRGVYLVGAAPPSWEQSAMAATLAVDDCWISHGSAAKLLGFRHAPQVGGIEVVSPYGRHRDLPGIVSHRSRILVAADVTRHKLIPVTSVARTIVECSGRLDVKRTGKLIDDAMRADPLALERTRACFARLAGGGRRRLRAVRGALSARLPGYDPGESDPELLVLRAIIRAGLPMPEQQHRVTIGGKRFRIDLAYPEWKIAIELASWAWHRGRESFDDDRARAADLVAEGWRVLEVTDRHTEPDIARWVSGVLLHAAA